MEVLLCGWNCESEQDQKVLIFWKSRSILCRKCTSMYGASHFYSICTIDSSSRSLFDSSLIPSTNQCLSLYQHMNHSNSREPFGLESYLDSIAESTAMKMQHTLCLSVCVPSPMGIPPCWLNISSSLCPCASHSER